MADFKINDDWVLNRVSSQSNSFSDWLKNILKDEEVRTSKQKRKNEENIIAYDIIII